MASSTRSVWGVLLSCVALELGCAANQPGIDPTTDSGVSLDGSSAFDAGPGGDFDSVPADAGTEDGVDAGSADGGVASDGGSSTDAGSALADPGQPGPYTYAEADETYTVSSTSDSVAIHVAYPTSGPTSSNFPVVVVGHGFEIAPSEYYAYVERLASFGFVALTVGTPDSLLNPNNEEDAADLSGGLDWALSATLLAGKVSMSEAGVMGHSAGGKDAVLAAVNDPRFFAVLGLDPVDSPPPAPATCNMTTQCPSAAALIANVRIPSLFLGETTDATATLMACAPASGNYTHFFAGANSPSIEVTVLGANHMSFVDDLSSCLVCGFCNTATASQTTVLNLAYEQTVAFFEWTLYGVAGYRTYLDGAQAQQLFVATQEATIVSK
jgi:dienelactone hydrolase